MAAAVPSPTMPITLSEGARHLGITPGALQSCIRSLAIRDLSEYADVHELEEEYTALVLPRAEAAAARVVVEGHTLRDLRAKHELLKLHLTEIELEERKKRFYRRETVDKAWVEVAQRLRDALLNL